MHTGTNSVVKKQAASKTEKVDIDNMKKGKPTGD